MFLNRLNGNLLPVEDTCSQGGFHVGRGADARHEGQARTAGVPDHVGIAAGCDPELCTGQMSRLYVAESSYTLTGGRADGRIAVVDATNYGVDNLLVHREAAEDPSVAFAISRLSDPVTLTDTPIGVFRKVERPSFDRLVGDQQGPAAHRGEDPAHDRDGEELDHADGVGQAEADGHDLGQHRQGHRGGEGVPAAPHAPPRVPR